MTLSNYSRRNYHNLNGFTPFNSTFQSNTIYSNLRSTRLSSQKQSEKGYGPQRKSANYHRIHVPPTNHSWEEEHRALNICEDYETEGLVVWVDGSYGEVICERNIGTSYAHFYFDGSTEIDGQIVALAHRLGTFQLQPGSQIEFECRYLPPEPKEQVHMVHIRKMSLIKKESKTETMPICMLNSSPLPHEDKWALTENGDYVRVSPIVFSKDWIIESLNASVIGVVPEYVELDKEEYKAGRTFIGRVLKTPRWMLDGGREGEKGKNSRHFLLSVEERCERIFGQATIVHVVPFQSALLIADSRPNEPMYYPIVAYPLKYKQRIVKGARVDFVASKELPGFSYFWRVQAINLLQSSTPLKTRPSANREEVRKVTKRNCEEFIVRKMQQFQEAKKAKNVLAGETLPEEEDEKTKEDEKKTEEPAKAEENGSQIAEDVKENVQDEGEESSDEEGDAEMCELLGCSRRDVEEREIERVQTHHNLAVVYNHHVMTIAEKVAEEHRKHKKERRERKEYTKMSEENKAKVEQEVRKHYGLPMEKKTFFGGKKTLKTRGADIYKPLEPLENINFIGIYDDVKLSFDHILMENEKQKRETAASSQQAESATKKDSGGWWFQRKTPRLFPTFIMAELCGNRTVEEFCQDYDTDLLEETIVLRKNSCFIQEKPEMKATEEDDETSSPVQSASEEVIKEKRSAYVSSFFGDNILAGYIKTLKSAER